MTRKNSAAGKRKIYGNELREEAALEAIGGRLSVVDLVAKHGVRQSLVNIWKRQALESMSEIFSGKAEAKASKTEKLHAKIGSSWRDGFLPKVSRP